MNKIKIVDVKGDITLDKVAIYVPNRHMEDPEDDEFVTKLLECEGDFYLHYVCCVCEDDEEFIFKLEWKVVETCHKITCEYSKLYSSIPSTRKRKDYYYTTILSKFLLHICSSITVNALLC